MHVGPHFNYRGVMVIWPVEGKLIICTHVGDISWDHIMMWVCSSHLAWDGQGMLIIGLVITGLSSGFGVSLGVF